MPAAFLATFAAWAAAEQLSPSDALGRLAVAIATAPDGAGAPASGRAVIDDGVDGFVDGLVDGIDVSDEVAACDVPWVIPPGLARADLLGCAHEALLGADHRYANGVHYTPATIADGVVSMALTAPRARSATSRLPTVCDPAVGGGAFLLAAARWLEGQGATRAAIVEDLLWGVDVDPLAKAVSATALGLWAAETDRLPRSTNLVVGDSLRTGSSVWHQPPDGGFGVVVGNPPFQNQLGTATARGTAAAEQLRERFGPVLFRYADTAGLFLLEACRWSAPGGRVALILPQSILVADDAATLRRAVLDLGMLEGIWMAGEAVFGAGVRVCAPVIAVDGGDGGDGGDVLDSLGADDGATVSTVRRARGRTFRGATDHAVTRDELRAAPTWAPVVADLFGVPNVALPSATTLKSFCDATAGFRDQFYGLQPFVREATADERSAFGSPDAAPLITSGLIEPMRTSWGVRRTRFAGQWYDAPVVDLTGLAAGDAKLLAWTRDRLVPKLVVATQTRVLEAIVDERGAVYPSVPTIALTAAGDRVWHAAAVVMAPAVTAWAMSRHAGAALSDNSLKVSAKQLLEAPVPDDGDRWTQACDPLQRAAAAATEAGWRAALWEFGSLMGEAYGTDENVLDWWFDRLPAWSR
jgi:hypothetical protein